MFYNYYNIANNTITIVYCLNCFLISIGMGVALPKLLQMYDIPMHLHTKLHIPSCYNNWDPQETNS